jgi:hypothetical protein
VQTALWVTPQQTGARDQGQAGGDHRTGLQGPRQAVAVRPQCQPEVPGTRWPKTVRGRPVRRAHSCSLFSHGGLWRGCRPWAKMGVGLPADAVVSLALEAGV